MSDKPFEGVLGNTVQLKLLQYLMSTPRLDFNITELKRVTRVSRPSVDRTVKNFVQWGIVRETGKRGNMTFYAINEESQLVISMRRFNNGLMEIMFPELFTDNSSPFAAPCVSIEDANIPNTNEVSLTGTFNMFPKDLESSDYSRC
mgnify:CR=1 FL=1